MRTSSAVALALLLACAATAEAPGEGVYCGDDYWFEAKPPPDWKQDWEPSGEGLQLTFAPASSGEKPDTLISVALAFGPGSARPLNLDQNLMHQVGMLNAFGDVRDIRDSDLSHPTLPTRSVLLVGEKSHVVLLAIDPHSARGHWFLVALTTTTDASPAERKALQATLRSLRFDSGRICEPGPDGGSIARRIDAPPPAAASEAVEKSEAGLDAWLGAGLSGCAMLQRLFVPVQCFEASLGGENVWLVSFDDGSEPAATYRERFREKIAVPWCWQTRSRPDAPPLVFWLEDEKLGREYSCKARKLGRTLRGEPELIPHDDF